jgi:uncharacterized membrane protein
MNGRAIKSQRPKIKLARTQWENSFDLLAIIAIIYSIYIILANYSALPDSIPSHFGLSGKPDAYGGKATILLLPIVSMFLYVGMALVARFPHVFNYPVKITLENAEREYILARQFLSTVRAEIVCMFAYLTWNMVEVALGKSIGIGSLFLPVILVSLAISIIIYIVKARRLR